jgi:heme-degrading monooxygenase HmoA
MKPPMFANTPEPPYYAAIFSSLKTQVDAAYAEAAARMVQLAQRQPGYLGVEHASSDGGFGITVSYWNSLEAIAAWRAHAEHAVVQQEGRARWYEHYELRVARVERAASFGSARR